MIRVAAVQGPALDGYIVTSDDEHQVSSMRLIATVNLMLIIISYSFRNLFKHILAISILTDRFHSLYLNFQTVSFVSHGRAGPLEVYSRDISGFL